MAHEISANEFQCLPLRVHSFLTGIPLHSLDHVTLLGGRAGMNIQEISEVIGFGGTAEMKPGTLTQALFWLRGLIGRWLHWDDNPALVQSLTYLPRLTEEDRAHSRITPGQPAGISRILYQFDHEMLGEIVNWTVHCFWLLATKQTATGYELWIAVYVKKRNWFTSIYMALISPMLQWIIYPAMQQGIRRQWAQYFPFKGSENGQTRLVTMK